FRRVLLKSIGLALLLLVVIGIVLQRALVWLIGQGAGSVGVSVEPSWLWSILIWFASFATGIGIVAGAVFLMPAGIAFVGTFFVDEIAEQVEAAHYPNDPPGHALSFWRAAIEGLGTGLLAIAVYLCAAPLLLFVGFGFIIMFIANAYLLGREYFLLA